MRYSNDPSQLGSKLGPKLVHLISETIVATKRKLLDTEHQARVHSMQTIIDRAGSEIADLYRPVWEESLAETDMPDYVREHMTKIMSGRHQWQAIAGAALGYSGAGSSLGTIISNFLAPGVRTAVSKDPQLAPNPETMASLGAKGTFDLGKVFDLSHGAGYSDDIISALVGASQAWPDVTTTLELLRRQVIGQGDARLYLKRTGVPDSVIPHLLRLESVILSPADLSDMAVRGVLTEQQAAVVASESGVSADDFHKLTLITGQPPGLEQMLEGYRRGFIDEATLERGIKESRYRNEWIPLLKALRYSPISVADAVNAVVQNHLTASQGEKIAQQNGLEPGQFAVLQETAGEPLSRTEMEELYNRGLVTQEQVNQALRESRVKDKYIDLAFQLHRRIIPIFTLERAIAAGAVSHADAIAIAMESGYSKRDAEIITSSGSSAKIDPYKKEVVSAVASAYGENTIPQNEALTLIEGLGFAASEAKFILEAQDFKRAARIVNQVATAVRSKYISRKIHRNQAGNDLDAIGIPATQRDFLLSLWDIELEANTRQLTEAQVVKAVHKQLITEQEGQSRLVAMGYSAADADLLIKGA
jgi:hypothetical protein